jgi:hypothetical protein
MALEELWLRDPFLRFGHTSLAAARILLQSRAVCAGCDKNIGLRGLAATARQPARRLAGLDFGFARHPQCPACRARRTMRAVYGLPATPYVAPWKHLSGCCVSDEKWICSKCRHTW